MVDVIERRLISRLHKIADIKAELTALSEQCDQKLSDLRQLDDALSRLIQEKTAGFPWLADAIAQYYQACDFDVAGYMTHKLRPAIASAQRVKDVAREKRELQRDFRVARNLLKYYEHLFPWLSDFVGENIDDLLVQVRNGVSESEDEGADPVAKFLSSGEYAQLSPQERNQRALDRYWTGRKTSWEIGRDYERYIGYLYEKEGYSVRYQGIEQGLEDLGRDLICTKRGATLIVQCKCWREERTIHEKHINQLFGTTVMYTVQRGVEHRQGALFSELASASGVRAVFVTSAKFSPVAQQFANALDIQLRERVPFQRYPSVKCNISRRSETKIYHLPFDQQYDKTIIEEERNECYAESVAEAEALGYRRAWRWRGAT